MSRKPYDTVGISLILLVDDPAEQSAPCEGKKLFGLPEATRSSRAENQPGDEFPVEFHVLDCYCSLAEYVSNSRLDIFMPISDHNSRLSDVSNSR
jgi:hypothetical protein